MTRDEATRLVRDGGPIGGVYKSYDEALVDSLVALGILKLDEPKTYNICGLLVPMKAVITLNNSGWDLRLFKVLDDAGLRIVEK